MPCISFCQAIKKEIMSAIRCLACLVLFTLMIHIKILLLCLLKALF